MSVRGRLNRAYTFRNVRAFTQRARSSYHNLDGYRISSCAYVLGRQGRIHRRMGEPRRLIMPLTWSLSILEGGSSAFWLHPGSTPHINRR